MANNLYTALKHSKETAVQRHLYIMFLICRLQTAGDYECNLKIKSRDNYSIYCCTVFIGNIKVQVSLTGPFSNSVPNPSA